VEQLLGLEVGRRYSFKGINPDEGWADVTELAKKFNIYWAVIHREGPLNGKLFPFDELGVFIGARHRWPIPDLEFEIGQIEHEIAIETELPIEQEAQEKELEL
jgi:hypothetical protein